jgi:uncharacterized membrane protein YedE/YeeE
MENFTPLPALAGGVLIGVASVWLLAANGRIAGVSGILHGLAARIPGDAAWRASFIAGLVIAGYCPGPALTALAGMNLEPAVFVLAMIAGGLAHKLAFDRPARP